MRPSVVDLREYKFAFSFLDVLSRVEIVERNIARIGRLDAIKASSVVLDPNDASMKGVRPSRTAALAILSLA